MFSVLFTKHYIPNNASTNQREKRPRKAVPVPLEKKKEMEAKNWEVILSDTM